MHIIIYLQCIVCMYAPIYRYRMWRVLGGTCATEFLWVCLGSARDTGTATPHSVEGLSGLPDAGLDGEAGG